MSTAALPAPSSAPVSTVREGSRLCMYGPSALETSFWESKWRVDPPRRRQGGRLERRLRGPLTRFLPRDGVVVEAGCGNGNIMRALAGEGFRVEGIDFAAEVIEANRRVDPVGSYQVADVRRMPYGDGELAGYVSLGVVEHFGDAERRGVLAEAVRCLRPGGVAVVSTPHYHGVRRVLAALGRYEGMPAGPTVYQYFFTPVELRRQVREAGLEIVATDYYDVYKGLKDTVGLKGLLDAGLRRGGVIGRLIEHPPRAVRALCAHMVLVVARKPGGCP